jgi:hypothetical protein
MSLLFSFTLSLISASASVGIIPPSEKPYGLTYEEHVKNFWKWILSIPRDENPVADSTGKFCTNGQTNSNSSVFYLAFNNAGSSERICNVPAGKGLFIPVMQVEWSELEAPNEPLSELDQRAKNEQDKIDLLSLTINDKKYDKEELLKYRVHTTPFKIIFGNPPIFDAGQGGPAQTVADGYYVVTEPLTRGNYTVHFHSSVPLFVQSIKYDIVAR